MYDAPRSLKREISPPPAVLRKATSPRTVVAGRVAATKAAKVEAGIEVVEDHLEFWATALAGAVSQCVQSPLSIPDYRALYERNQHANGHHFVVHQHDHPVSGASHPRGGQWKDCRLMVSSLSFAIPYGLVGNANSARPNRMAIETRVHNLWNNLIESASHASGSLLIWDTGEYEVLPRPKRHTGPLTDDEASQSSTTEPSKPAKSESAKLAEAFQSRHMHIRLHGTRLPAGYTLAMRMPRQEYRTRQPNAPKRRRRMEQPRPVTELMTDSDSSGESSSTATATDASETAVLGEAAAASDDEARDVAEIESIRRNNAYPGATNSIGSVHQRHWFLSLDRGNSGFVKARAGPDKGRWLRRKLDDGREAGFETFFVMGREVETSIVTGRRAEDLMREAGIKQYKGRKMWMPITR